MNNNEMTVKSTIEELRFALEHDIELTKHEIFSLLNRYEVEKVCNELGIKASVRATFMEGSDGQPYRGYYVLSFSRNEGYGSTIGTYFGVDLVTKSADYITEGEAEDEKF